MGFWDLAGKWAARSGRPFGNDLDAPFDPSTGHYHNGTDSKAVAGGAADDTTLTLTEGVFAVKAGGIVAESLGVTAGTASASKAAVLGANKNLDVLAVADLKLGAGAGTSITPTAAQINLLAQGVAGGYKVARGVTAVTGTADVTTGLATVVAWAANLTEDPSADATIVSGVIPTQSGGTAGHLTLKAWKPTAADNSAPTAALVAKNVAWIAIGT